MDSGPSVRHCNDFSFFFFLNLHILVDVATMVMLLLLNVVDVFLDTFLDFLLGLILFPYGVLFDYLIYFLLLSKTFATGLPVLILYFLLPELVLFLAQIA